MASPEWAICVRLEAESGRSGWLEGRACGRLASRSTGGDRSTRPAVGHTWSPPSSRSTEPVQGTGGASTAQGSMAWGGAANAGALFGGRDRVILSRKLDQVWKD